jgi:hypothetical protein
MDLDEGGVGHGKASKDDLMIMLPKSPRKLEQFQDQDPQTTSAGEALPAMARDRHRVLSDKRLSCPGHRGKPAWA